MMTTTGTPITNWRTSSYSDGSGLCVETGWTLIEVGFRDSKQAHVPAERRPTLVFPLAAGGRFLRMIRT